MSHFLLLFLYSTDVYNNHNPFLYVNSNQQFQYKINDDPDKLYTVS